MASLKVIVILVYCRKSTYNWSDYMASLKVTVATAKIFFIHLRVFVLSQSATTKPLKRLLMDSASPFNSPFQPLCLNKIYKKQLNIVRMCYCFIHRLCCSSVLGKSSPLPQSFDLTSPVWKLSLAQCFVVVMDCTQTLKF